MPALVGKRIQRDAVCRADGIRCQSAGQKAGHIGVLCISRADRYPHRRQLVLRLWYSKKQLLKNLWELFYMSEHRVALL